MCWKSVPVFHYPDREGTRSQGNVESTRNFFIFTKFRPLLPKSQRNQVKQPLPTPRRQNVVHNIVCSEYTNAYVCQTGRQFDRRTIEHQSAVRRQDSNSLLAPQTGHAFDWTRPQLLGMIQAREHGILLRSGTQQQRMLTNARQQTRSTKPSQNIGSAKARYYKQPVAPPPTFMLILT